MINKADPVIETDVVKTFERQEVIELEKTLIQAGQGKGKKELN